MRPFVFVRPLIDFMPPHRTQNESEPTNGCWCGKSGLPCCERLASCQEAGATSSFDHDKTCHHDQNTRRWIALQIQSIGFSVHGWTFLWGTHNFLLSMRQPSCALSDGDTQDTWKITGNLFAIVQIARLGIIWATLRPCPSASRANNEPVARSCLSEVGTAGSPCVCCWRLYPRLAGSLVRLQNCRFFGWRQSMVSTCRASFLCLCASWLARLAA